MNLTELIATLKAEFPRLSWLVRSVSAIERLGRRRMEELSGIPSRHELMADFFAHIHTEERRPDGDFFASFLGEGATPEAAFLAALEKARKHYG